MERDAIDASVSALRGLVGEIEATAARDSAVAAAALSRVRGLERLIEVWAADRCAAGAEAPAVEGRDVEAQTDPAVEEPPPTPARANRRASLHDSPLAALFKPSEDGAHRP